MSVRSSHMATTLGHEKTERGAPTGVCWLLQKTPSMAQKLIWIPIRSSQQHLLNVLGKHTYHRCSIQPAKGWESAVLCRGNVFQDKEPLPVSSKIYHMDCRWCQSTWHRLEYQYDKWSQQSQHPKPLDTVCDNGSEQMVKFPTRQMNTLGVFVTNRPSLIQKCKPVPRVSDHDIVFVESNISDIRSKPPQRKLFLWKRANYVGMKESVGLASALFVAKNKTSTDINQLWCDFKDMCQKAITDNVPTKMTSTRFNQPWINRNVKRLSRRKKKAYRRAQQTNSHEDKEKYKKL